MNSTLTISYPSAGVGLVLIDDGHRNFLTWALNEELERALGEVADRGCEVVVVGSTLGDYFVSHGSLDDIVEQFGGGTPSGDAMAGLRVKQILDLGPMVSIAAVDGQAWGGGCELALACDLRVASETAHFGQPEVRVGVSTVGGAGQISRIAGEAAALEMILDGRPVTAHRAYELGLVHRIVSSGTAVEQALAWAVRLTKAPPGALAMAKDVVKGARELSYRDALKRETRTFVERLSDPTNLERARTIRDRYAAGADSWEAFGLDTTD